eukprot:193302-Pleurochrysis_carterae.AAC.2
MLRVCKCAGLCWNLACTYEHVCALVVTRVESHTSRPPNVCTGPRSARIRMRTETHMRGGDRHARAGRQHACPPPPP